jgi:hypothetical protein
MNWGLQQASQSQPSRSLHRAQPTELFFVAHRLVLIAESYRDRAGEFIFGRRR